RFGDHPTARYPAVSASVPMPSGRAMPNRSARRPISTPPPAKPNMTMVKGSEASARLTPKSAWMAGSATMYDHIPTPPMVDSSTATPRRSHAVGESISDGALAPIGEIIVLINPGYIGPLVALSRGGDHPSFGGAVHRGFDWWFGRSRSVNAG